MSAKRNDTPEDKERIAKFVAGYLLGDKAKGIEPLTITEIATTMGFKSRKSVYAYRDLAVKLGLLEVDEDGNVIRQKKTVLGQFKLFKVNHELLDDPLIADWWKKQCSKNGTHGTKIQFTMLRNLEAFFNTLHITPNQLVIQKLNSVVENFRDDYMIHYKNESDWRKNPEAKHGDPASKKYQMNQALNSFCNLNGIVWARGSKEMERVVTGHGKYSKVRFTKEDFRNADKYLIDNFGIDSDEYRWFWIGVETCSRASALRVMKLDYTETKNEDGTTKSLHLDTFESKQEHTKKGGEVEKFVRRPNTIESIKRLRARGCHGILENTKGLTETKLALYLTQTMKNLYIHLGKDMKSLYFIRPNHSLRHLGAQFWLAKSDYKDFSIVAKIGDWSTVQELIDSYGDTPPDVFQKTIDGYDYSD